MSASRVVLVTGGNRGIGLATATELAQSGHRVAVTYRSEPPPSNGQVELLGVHCDVTDEGGIGAAFADIEEKLGPVEVLVSNAGITRDKLVMRMSEADFTDVIDANLTAGYRVAKRAARSMMRNRWGRIVFVSSVVGIMGQAGQANYAASKAGMIGFSKSLAQEVASRGITVNCVAPGFIESPMTDALNDDQKANLLSRIPLGRMGVADEIASAVAFLASEEAGYITGQTLHVNGGMAMI